MAVARRGAGRGARVAACATAPHARQAGTLYRAKSDWPGRDSEFYALERSRRDAAGRGWPGKAPRTGRVRLAAALPATAGETVSETLAEAARLHERYRFDPAGLPAPQRASCAGCARGYSVN